MSDVIADLKVRVELENAQIKSQIEGIENKFKELGSTVKAQSTKVDGFGEATKKLGGIMAGIAAISFLKKAGEEAIQNVKSQTLLQIQMEKTTGANQQQVDSVLAQIDALEKLSNVQAEDLRPQFEVFLRSTHDSAEAMDLLNTALNYSSETGKDLGSVTTAMAKAYNGSTTSLVKLAPEVKNVDDKLGYLKNNFQGAAKAAADKDPYGKFEVTMKNLYEAVGMTLLPVLSQLATWFQSALELVKPWLPLIEGIAAGFVAYKIGLMGLTVYQTIYNGIMALSTAATEGFTIALASTGIGAIAIAVGLLTAGLIALNGQMDAAAVDRTPEHPYTAAQDARVEQLTSIAKLKAIRDFNDTYLKEHPTVATIKVTAANINDPLYKALFKGYKVGDVIPLYDEATAKRRDIAADKAGIAETNRVQTYYAQLNASTVSTVQTTATTTTTPKDTKLVDYVTATRKSILDLQAKYQADMVKAQQDYADAVQTQIDNFRQSFADATNVNLGDLFTNGAKSADKLITALKDKLTGIKRFTEDLGKLSAAGYNAEFLKQIIAQGPVVGDQMAKALLGASPEAQAELQSMFKDTQDASAHGVDTLSLSIADQFNVSTKALSDAMLAAANTLNEALSNLQFTFQGKTNEIGVNSTQQQNLVTKVGKEIGGAKNPNGVNYVITNYVTTNATAEQIAVSTVHAIKFGQPTVALGVNPFGT